MGSLLIIENNYKIDPKLQKLLEKVYRTYIVKDPWDGLNIIGEHHIDMFAVMSDDHRERFTEDFFRELEATRSDAISIILISETPTIAIQSKANEKGWYLIKYPIDHQQLINALKRAMIVANALNDRVIVFYKGGHRYPYQLKHITRIQRSRNRSVKVYSQNPDKPVEEVEEFFFKYPLSEFSKYYDVERYIKQAHQSWLVNTSAVREVRAPDLELVLSNGRVVPTSKNYIENFINVNERAGDAHEFRLSDLATEDN